MLAAFQGRCPICTSHVHVVAFTDDWDDIKVMDETACFACTAYASAVSWCAVRWKHFKGDVRPARSTYSLAFLYC